MSDLLHEMRHALRGLARRPGLSALAVISLGLGIGVNSAIFSLVNAILLREPGVARPAELVEIYTSDSDGLRYATSSYPDYADLRAQNDVLSGLAAYNPFIATYDDGSHTELLLGEIVSGNFFEVLGIQPALGRSFLPEEDATPGTHPVVILGHAFWQGRLGGDPDVIGREIRLNGKALTVVGVAPAPYKGSLPGLAANYWLPLMLQDTLGAGVKLESRGSRWLWMKGRLKPGVDAAQAQAQLGTLMQGLGAAHPDTNEGRALTVVPVRQIAINPAIDGPVFGVAGFLMITVGFVLLIACSNIANLLLARAADRRKEIAIRLALGSGRSRLVRQLLSESLTLALLGGAVGLVFAVWTTQLIVSFRPPVPLPISFDVGLDLRVLGFTFALALVTGVLCGLAPALQASRPALVPALKGEGAAMGRAYRTLGLRNLLVVSQVMISTLLLIGAGLFLRSLLGAQSIDPGFSARRGAVARLALDLGQRYDEEEGRVFYRNLLERTLALPGVRGAALVSHLPLGGEVRSAHVRLEGQPLAEKEHGPEVDNAVAGVGYFTTLGIPLLRGRAFDEGDTAGAPPVAVVNETLARRFWPGEEPIGKRLARGGEDEPYLEVVGVVGDGKYRTLGEAPRPFLYMPFAQSYSPDMALVAVSEGNERALLAQVRAELEALDPSLPIFHLGTLGEHLSIMLFLPRMGAGLLAAMGLLGLLLASVGLYGVVAYAVSKRTREVGIRMALGAGGGDVLRLVVREGMALVAVGIALGIAAALAGSRVLGSLLYGIGTSDPVTYVTIPLLLAGVAFLANLLPALRATRVDPIRALRYE